MTSPGATTGKGWLGLGDAAEVCARLPAAVAFDLVYLDPPFAAGGVRSARTRRGESRAGADAGPEAYRDPADPEALIEMLMPRLAVIRERMARGATMYLHLDHRAVHEAKVACDGLFGRGAFLGEIIWVPGNGGRGTGGMSVTHQTILVYARRAEERGEVVYNGKDPALREPYAETSLAMHFTRRDEEGRAYRERVVAGKAYRYFADEGRRMGSVWSDVPAMLANTPLRKETTGYPTQKPVKLLERIVRASSREGSVVADLMCGSGTTLVAAAWLGRGFVGGDRSEMAVGVAERRLREMGARVETVR